MNDRAVPLCAQTAVTSKIAIMQIKTNKAQLTRVLRLTLDEIWWHFESLEVLQTRNVNFVVTDYDN